MAGKKELESSIIGGKAQTVLDEVNQAKKNLFKAIAVAERPEGSLNSLCSKDREQRVLNSQVRSPVGFTQRKRKLSPIVMTEGSEGSEAPAPREEGEWGGCLL